MFQTKFILLFLLLVILSSITSGIVLYQRTNMDLGYRYGEAHSKLKKTGEILLPNVLLGNIIAVVVIGAASVVITLLISHKVAGPLYRFEKNTEQIAQGDLTVITKLRQSDQIQGLAGSLTKMTAELREKLLDVRKNSEKLPILVDEMKRLSQKETISSQELSGIAARLSRISSDFQESFKNFKL
ncbi:MAG: hypothetical protein ACMUIA_11960 [bacterium]